VKRGQCAVRGASHAQMPRHNAANRAENESTASQARPPDIRYILTACCDVSYSAFDVQKDDSHTGQGRVADWRSRRADGGEGRDQRLRPCSGLPGGVAYSG